VREKENPQVTLVNYMDASKEEWGRTLLGGVGCRCTECQKLKEKKDN
jgi:hypothetical protein